MLKNKKGVTLTMLAIVVAVLIIVSATVMYSGVNDMKDAREKKLLSELEIVNHAVFESYVNYTKTKNQSYIVGEAVETNVVLELASEIGITLVTIPNDYDLKLITYYRLTPKALEKIGIDNSKDTYIVNYLTGEVINETKKKTESDKPLYTYSVKKFNNDVTAF